MTDLRVIVQPGTGYELLLSALLVADPSARSRVDMASALQRRARHIDPWVGRTLRRIGREPFISLLGWVHAMTESPSALLALDSFDAADPDELFLAALGYHRRAMRAGTPTSVMRAAATGDVRSMREFRRSSFPELGHWQASLRYLLPLGAAAFRDELGRTLRAWYELAFGAIEAGVATEQEADVARARQVAVSKPIDEVVEELAPGAAIAREVSQSLVVLVPSVVLRPAFALTDYGSTLVLAFPAWSAASQPSEPERLAMLANAIADPLRVRALRELRKGPLSTSELARRLGVPRTSLQHHVAVLTQAGVATIGVDDARTGSIRLRPEAIAEIGTLARDLATEPEH